MPWASAGETALLTGVSVDSAVLAQAQGVIDVFSGVVEEQAEHISARNLRLLKSAVAYQAAWMAGQIDVTTRVDVAELDQDGTRMKVSDPDALVLAPLAKRCLDRLTWRGPRSSRVAPFSCARAVFGSPGDAEAAFLRDGRGFDQGWRPL